MPTFIFVKFITVHIQLFLFFTYKFKNTYLHISLRFNFKSLWLPKKKFIISHLQDLGL